MAKSYRCAEKPTTCPKCKSTRIIDYLYGMPTYDAYEEAQQGKFILGGCELTGNDPQWHCAACKTDFYPALEITRDALITPQEVHELRLSVGWPSTVKNRDRDIKRCYAHFSCRVLDDLAGMLFVISDGASDALLNNLTVHPMFRKTGVGKALLQNAVRELAEDGIKYFNVVFDDELEPFYRKCGFHIMKSGVVDLHEGKPEWL